MAGTFAVTISGIYQIVNEVNGKQYIGSSAELRQRRIKHFGDLRRNKHYNPYLQNAWNKYGAGAFGFNVLFLCDPKNCILFEQRYLDFHQPFKWTGKGYNLSPTAGSPLGVKRSDEFRQNMKGNSRGFGSKHPHTEETKRKMSKSHTGKTLSEEHKRKIGLKSRGNQYGLGYKHTEAAKRKIGLASLGNQYSLGHKHTGESKRKMSLLLIGNTRQAKLSEKDVYEIRRLHATGKTTHKVLGKMFKLSRVAITNIINRRNWRRLK